MTDLPTRLRASAQEMRGLFLVSENVPNVRMIYKEDRDHIARELEEAAQALEAQREDRREVLRILYEAHRKTNPSPSLAAISAAIQHLQAVEDATSAQVAQEVAAGVATRTVSVDLLQRAIDALGKTNARDVWCDLRCAAGVATDGGQR